MWIMIKDVLYNLDHYRVIEGDITPNGKTYLSMTAINNEGKTMSYKEHIFETRIELTKEEIRMVIKGIINEYKKNLI